MSAATAVPNRRAKRSADGLCIRCGNAPPAPDRASCEPCLEKRRAADRGRYAAARSAGKLYGGADVEGSHRSGRPRTRRRQQERRETGLCIRCGKRPPAGGRITCAPCRDRRQARERRQYAERRAAGLCARCGTPVHDGPSRCAPCAERSYHRSEHFRGIPIWDPTWTVIEIASGREHGPFGSEADVALCLVFEKLARHQVKVLCDASPMSSLTNRT